MNYKYCVIGNLSTRQKILATKLLRESKHKVIALDEYNAKTKHIIDNAEFLVLFMKDNEADDVTMEECNFLFPYERILIEDEHFPMNEIPQ
jgi:DNA-directed RNA polymerase